MNIPKITPETENLAVDIIAILRSAEFAIWGAVGLDVRALGAEVGDRINRLREEVDEALSRYEKEFHDA